MGGCCRWNTGQTEADRAEVCNGKVTDLLKIFQHAALEEENKTNLEFDKSDFILHVNNDVKITGMQGTSLK